MSEQLPPVDAPPTAFDLYLERRLLSADLTLDVVAAVCMLDPAEIEWAIEEYGRCDGVDASSRVFTLVAHGAPLPAGDAIDIIGDA